MLFKFALVLQNRHAACDSGSHSNSDRHNHQRREISLRVRFSNFKTAFKFAIFTLVIFKFASMRLPRIKKMLRVLHEILVIRQFFFIPNFWSRKHLGEIYFLKRLETTYHLDVYTISEQQQCPQEHIICCTSHYLINGHCFSKFQIQIYSYKDKFFIESICIRHWWTERKTRDVGHSHAARDIHTRRKIDRSARRGSVQIWFY